MGTMSRATAHNSYVYGEGARAGWTHYTPAVGLILPFLPWGGMLRASYSRSYVVYSENRHGSYVRPSDNLQRVVAMMMWNISF